MESGSKVYYIAPYLPRGEKYQKHYSPAAQSKAEYIRSKLKNYNTTTLCVNCSLTVDNSFFLSESIKDKNGESIVLISKSSQKRLLLPLCGALMLISIFFFVLFNISKRDTVVLYHSIYYDHIIVFLKKIKKYKLIYEVEEIYADVRHRGIGREGEIRQCESAADAFIFPTEMLNEAVNKHNKPYVIIYGAYNPDSHKMEKKHKNVTAVVYSGTLMKGKGASQAIECASALDNKFEVRIIGYGSHGEINEINELIKKNHSQCRVRYDGMKYGEEYFNYLLDCDIGLCIQSNENRFNDTSFPSKILNYFNCGLKVVVSEMESLRKSKLAGYMFFSKDSTPNEIAKAIRKAQKTDVDSQVLLQHLDIAASKGIHDIFKFIYGE